MLNIKCLRNKHTKKRTSNRLLAAKSAVRRSIRILNKPCTSSATSTQTTSSQASQYHTKCSHQEQKFTFKPQINQDAKTKATKSKFLDQTPIKSSNPSKLKAPQTLPRSFRTRPQPQSQPTPIQPTPSKTPIPTTSTTRHTPAKQLFGTPARTPHKTKESRDHFDKINSKTVNVLAKTPLKPQSLFTQKTHPTKSELQNKTPVRNVLHPSSIRPNSAIKATTTPSAPKTPHNAPVPLLARQLFHTDQKVKVTRNLAKSVLRRSIDYLKAKREIQSKTPLVAMTTNTGVKVASKIPVIKIEPPKSEDDVMVQIPLNSLIKLLNTPKSGICASPALKTHVQESTDDKIVEHELEKNAQLEISAKCQKKKSPLEKIKNKVKVTEMVSPAGLRRLFHMKPKKTGGKENSEAAVSPWSMKNLFKDKKQQQEAAILFNENCLSPGVFTAFQASESEQERPLRGLANLGAGGGAVAVASSGASVANFAPVKHLTPDYGLLKRSARLVDLEKRNALSAVKSSVGVGVGLSGDEAVKASVLRRKQFLERELVKLNEVLTSDVNLLGDEGKKIVEKRVEELKGGEKLDESIKAMENLLQQFEHSDDNEDDEGEDGEGEIVASVEEVDLDDYEPMEIDETQSFLLSKVIELANENEALERKLRISAVGVVKMNKQEIDEEEEDIEDDIPCEIEKAAVAVGENNEVQQLNDANNGDSDGNVNREENVAVDRDGDDEEANMSGFFKLDDAKQIEQIGDDMNANGNEQLGDNNGDNGEFDLVEVAHNTTQTHEEKKDEKEEQENKEDQKEEEEKKEEDNDKVENDQEAPVQQVVNEEKAENEVVDANANLNANEEIDTETQIVQDDNKKDDENEVEQQKVEEKGEEEQQQKHEENNEIVKETDVAVEAVVDPDETRLEEQVNEIDEVNDEKKVVNESLVKENELENDNIKEKEDEQVKNDDKEEVVVEKESVGVEVEAVSEKINVDEVKADDEQLVDKQEINEVEHEQEEKVIEHENKDDEIEVEVNAQIEEVKEHHEQENNIVNDTQQKEDHQQQQEKEQEQEHEQPKEQHDELLNENNVEAKDEEENKTSEVVDVVESTEKPTEVQTNAQSEVEAVEEEPEVEEKPAVKRRGRARAANKKTPIEQEEKIEVVEQKEAENDKEKEDGEENNVVEKESAEEIVSILQKAVQHAEEEKKAATKTTTTTRGRAHRTTKKDDSTAADIIDGPIATDNEPAVELEKPKRGTATRGRKPKVQFEAEEEPVVEVKTTTTRGRKAKIQENVVMESEKVEEKVEVVKRGRKQVAKTVVDESEEVEASSESVKGRKAPVRGRKAAKKTENEEDEVVDEPVIDESEEIESGKGKKAPVRGRKVPKKPENEEDEVVDEPVVVEKKKVTRGRAKAVEKSDETVEVDEAPVVKATRGRKKVVAKESEDKVEDDDKEVEKEVDEPKTRPKRRANAKEVDSEMPVLAAKTRRKASDEQPVVVEVDTKKKTTRATRAQKDEVNDVDNGNDGEKDEEEKPVTKTTRGGARRKASAK